MSVSDFAKHMPREEDFRVGAPAPKPPPLRSESEIVRNWRGDTPVVSVLCATYNHENFIDDAVQGLLAQNTNFPFEVLIRDDASTDSTAEIVRDFEKRYPTIIRGIYEEENRYPAVWPFEALRREAVGTFLAICEGDDYWVDGRKLQYQVEALEAKPDMALAFHRVAMTIGGQIVFVGKNYSRDRRNFSAEELKRGEPSSHTCARLFRNVHLENVYVNKVQGGDQFLGAQLGLYGGATYVDGLLPSVYRKDSGGVWNSLSGLEQDGVAANTFYYIGLFFKERGEEDVAEHWRNRGLGCYSGLTDGPYVHIRGYKGVFFALGKTVEASAKFAMVWLKSQQSLVRWRFHTLVRTMRSWGKAGKPGPS